MLVIRNKKQAVSHTTSQPSRTGQHCTAMVGLPSLTSSDYPVFFVPDLISPASGLLAVLLFLVAMLEHPAKSRLRREGLLLRQNSKGSGDLCGHVLVEVCRVQTKERCFLLLVKWQDRHTTFFEFLAITETWYFVVLRIPVYMV